ncbi:unnamed protein product, partial [Staurois parvus]
PAFTISALPEPRIHYIRSPPTPHSLYTLVSRTPHSLYPLSPGDPAFTISGLPQYTEHGNAIIFSKYKLLNTFSHQQYIAVL